MQLNGLRRMSYVPDLWVQLRPTTPLRPPGLIERAIKLLEENSEADCVRTVQESPITPYKMWRWEQKYLLPFVQIVVIHHVSVSQKQK